MPGKTSILVLCFSYSRDPSRALGVAHLDLAQVLDYACWLEAEVHLVLDFDPAERQGSPPALELPRLLRQANVVGQIILEAGEKSSAVEPRDRETDAGESGSGEPKMMARGRSRERGGCREKVLAAAAAIRGGNLIVYYGGHADHQYLSLPDDSRLAILDLHRELSWGTLRNICWIFDACRMSGKSLRLPFICSPTGPVHLGSYGLHPIPTIALSASMERARLDGKSVQPEEASVTEDRAFAEKGEGSLFTSALFPLLMSGGRYEWSGLLGALSRLWGYKNESEAVCLKLYAYISDCNLVAIPHWMKKQCVEKVGSCWLVRR